MYVANRMDPGVLALHRMRHLAGSGSIHAQQHDQDRRRKIRVSARLPAVPAACASERLDLPSLEL